MPVIPANQLAFLRDQHPHTARVEWYLAVAPYGTACFSSQANDPGGTLVRGSQVIPYDDTPLEANVSAGMTLWVGSAAGLDDLGRVRIKSINAGADTITVAENTDIPWVDNQFLTCPGAYGFREIWGKYPRLTEVGGVPDFYMDYDDDFTDPADTVIPPKANAGPPVCAWIDPTTGNADVSFTGDTSYTTEIAPAAIASYLWDYADGVVIIGNIANAGTCAAPNVVRWTTPGFRYISLTVTDNTAQARTAIVYVPVWIFEHGIEDPFTLAEISNQSGDADRGWSARIKAFRSNTAAEDIIYHWPDGALVVIFTRTWFGDTETGVGGWCMAGDKHYRDNIRLVGWLMAETLTYDSDAGTVEFEAVSHDGIMRLIPGFPFTIEDDATPVDWYEVNALNVDRALHFLLEYYSTVNQVCDVEQVGEGANRTLAIQKFPDASLYDQAQEHLLGDAHCLLLSDRQGILYATRDPQFLDAAGRLGVDVACHLQQALGDWMNELDMDKPHRPRAGQSRLGGFAYETPLLSQCPIATPGDVPAVPLQSHNDLRPDGLILQNQAEANLWSGLTLMAENNEYKEMPLDLTGYWPVFDPAYQEYVELTAVDPLTRKSWTQEKFLVRGVEFNDNIKAGTSLTSLTLEKASEILYGETVTVPIEPVPAAPLPPPAPIEPPTVPPPGDVKMTVAWDKEHLAWTADFLRHHVSSLATVGTGGVDLFDTTQDFVASEIAVGDTVENMSSGTYQKTTVAGIVTANHLTLTGAIALAPGSGYHICGTQWVDITPAVLGAHEYIVQFVYIRTSADAVAGWCLTSWDGTAPVGTQGRVFYAPDILTAAPAWAMTKQLSATQADIGCANTGYQGIAINATNPQYAIVSLAPNSDPEPNCAMYTNNSGGAWAYSVFVIDAGDRPGHAAGHFGIIVDHVSGIIYNQRWWTGVPGNQCRLWISFDGGANFDHDTVACADFADNTRRASVYMPYVGGIIYSNPTNSDGGALPHAPVKWSGGAWSAMAIPAGYDDDTDGKCGPVGWYGDPNDVLNMFHLTGSGSAIDWHLHRSSDGGASWLNIGDADPLFEGTTGGWAGCIAMPAHVWENDQQMVFWLGLCPSGSGGVHTQCRIRYTDDNGTLWFNKMGNWYTTFGHWQGAAWSSGGAGTIGIIPLPRVGANA